LTRPSECDIRQCEREGWIYLDISPAGALDPVTVNNEGALAVLGQSGEY
jgi:hypothetical protein